MILAKKSEFNDIVEKYPYYQNRWEYFEAVQDMIETDNVLEIGSYYFPIVTDCDTADIKGNPKYKMDLNKYPWDFKDKQYDLVIALQTLEHLEDKKKAFQEMKRIAHSAIISLPFEWYTPEDDEHHNIDLDTITDWFPDLPVSIEYVGNKIILKYVWTDIKSDT